MLSLSMHLTTALVFTTLILLSSASVSPGLTLAYFAQSTTSNSQLITGQWLPTEIQVSVDSTESSGEVAEIISNPYFADGLSDWQIFGDVRHIPLETDSAEVDTLPEYQVTLTNGRGESSLSQQLDFPASRVKQVAILYQLEHQLDADLQLPLVTLSWADETLSVLSSPTHGWQWFFIPLEGQPDSGELRIALVAEDVWDVPVTLRIAAITTDFLLLNELSQLSVHSLPQTNAVNVAYVSMLGQHSVLAEFGYPLSFEYSPLPYSILTLSLETAAEQSPLVRQLPLLIDSTPPEGSSSQASITIQDDQLALLMRLPSDDSSLVNLEVRFWSTSLNPTSAQIDLPRHTFESLWNFPSEQSAVWQVNLPDEALWMQWRVKDAVGHWSSFSPFTLLER